MNALLDRLFGQKRGQRREGVKARIRKRLGMRARPGQPAVERYAVPTAGSAQPAQPAQPVSKPPAVKKAAQEQFADGRLEKAVQAGDKLPARAVQRRLLRANMPKHRRALLFLRIGDKALAQMRRHLAQGEPKPVWAQRLGGGTWTLVRGRVHFDGLPFARHAEKRTAVKRLYFDPREPSTILPITEKLRARYCNVSRRDVRTVLRSLETYQRNLGRRKPQEVKTHTVMRAPGVIAIDAFFPSKAIDGWEGEWSMVLCCMDTWSRFSRRTCARTRRA